MYCMNEGWVKLKIGYTFYIFSLKYAIIIFEISILYQVGCRRKLNLVDVITPNHFHEREAFEMLFSALRVSENGFNIFYVHEIHLFAVCIVLLAHIVDLCSSISFQRRVLVGSYFFRSYLLQLRINVGLHVPQKRSQSFIIHYTIRVFNSDKCARTGLFIKMLV